MPEQVGSSAALCPYCDLPGRLMGSGVRYVCDNRHYWPTDDGFCTCDDGDVRIDTSCGVKEHRERARAALQEARRAK